MPFEDLFSDALMAGSDREGWKSWFVIVFLILGAGVGGWLGYITDGVLWAIGGTLIGAFVGWLVGIALRGFVVIGLIMLAILPFVLGWMWLTGAFN